MKVSFNYPMFETRELAELGIFSGEYLALSSWWITLAEKLAVSGKMDLVEDIATYANRERRSKTLGIPSLIFSLS